ncbi:mdm2-binding protein [Plakobranchus ocellatus]|uniref:Mdm2-binding protein n=1 Tax=Plakobranchus ocellatus TaxID=259542 RepID=A0AAV4CSE8_9GAST|nr:mdm2-binding protein [Plakobranchus ocellatus]
MSRILIASSDSSDSRLCIKRYLDKVQQQVKDVAQSETILGRVIMMDQDLYHVTRVVPEDGWAPLEDLKSLVNFNSESDGECFEAPSDAEWLLADCLHDIADSLPFTGASLRTIFFLNGGDSLPDDEDDRFVPLAGATRRLVEWHNGDVILVNKASDLPPSKEVLVDFGHCRVVNNQDDINTYLSCWEGKIAVVDRIEDKGSIFSGYTLNSDLWEQMLQQKVKLCVTNEETIKQQGPGKKRGKPETVKSQRITKPVCGRTIEVLQEVDLRTFPFFLVDSWTLDLDIQEGHTDVLIEYIQELHQVGLLARLRVYPDREEIPCCGDTDSLCTEAWKKTVLANSCEEPAEEFVAEDGFFMYFLLLRSVCPNSTSAAVAQVLLSPKEINRSVIEIMNKQALTERNQPEPEPVDCDIDVQVLKGEAFAKLLRQLQEHRDNTEKEIIDRTKGLVKNAAEKVQQEILSNARKVEDKITSEAFQDHPSLSEYMQQENRFGLQVPFKWVSEASIDPEKFPEKMALQAKVAKKVELQSYPSTDSLLGSFPISLEEMEKKRYTTEFEVNDILRMFDKDGSPMSPPFTPEKLEGRNLCRVDSTPDLDTPWPNSQSLQYHDIYYYMDENDLGLEKKYSKIRDKILEQDTRCTFVSPIKKKSQRLSKISPVRSSPRRRNSAQYLMTRSRSDSVRSSSPAAPHRVQDVFKQPSLSRHLPSSRRLSLTQNTPESIPSSSHSHSHSVRRHSNSSGQATPTSFFTQHFSSQPVSHSTPVLELPCRVSPRKRALSRSFSSANIQSAPTLSSKGDSPHLNLMKQVSRKKYHTTVTPQMSTSLSKSSKVSQAHQLSQDRSLLSDPPVRRSPRKSGTFSNSSSSLAGSSMQRQTSCTSLSSSVVDLDESSLQSQPGSQQQARMKRSDRHKLKLKNIITTVLEEKGVKEVDTIYAACFKNLFNVSMVLLKALTTSQNLTEEMKNVVHSQVTQIINLEKRRCGINL